MVNKLARGITAIYFWARTLYEYVALYISLAVFALGAIFFSLVGAVLYLLLPRRFGARVGRRLITLIFWFYLRFIESTGLFKCDTSALDVLTADEAIIIAPNHPGLIDVLLIGSRLTNVVCIMKKDIRDNMLFGGSARLAGYICNDSIGNMVRTAVTELQQGSHLLIFPESTRTVTQPINKFTRAFALIASRASVPVQTVFIEYTSPFLGKGWPLWKKPQFPLTFKVTLGERFVMGHDTKLFVDNLEEYFRENLTVKNCPRPPEIK